MTDRRTGPDTAEVRDAYEPIDCGLHDRLEAWCVTRQRCRIRVANERGHEREVEARIEDVFAEGGEEFMLLDDGERIRLDRIVTIHASVPTPGRR